ncbi:MAG: glycosyltransferase [Clostridia bacterium]|nr:glycosyltransferase [Clostridia bacterium]
MVKKMNCNKKNKILITSTDVMMLQFLVPHVFYLQKNGYDISVACSNVENHIEELTQIFQGNVRFYVIDAVRNPFSLKNISGYKKLKELLKEHKFDLIWTNEPVMSVLTRLAARGYRKHGLKVLYVAHGFHFYKGASLIRWLLFYPIEKIMSIFTDKLITINSEDYAFAIKHFSRCNPVLFNGIGVNTQKFARSNVDFIKKRNEIDVPLDSILFLSVGELEKRKNHYSVITAFAKAKIENAFLVICGVGTQEKSLNKLIKKYNIDTKVRLLGYRYDIKELLETADYFILGSYQEGLSVAIMEAMAMEKICLVSKIRGNIDLIDEHRGILFNPKNIKSIKDAISSAAQKVDKFEEAKKLNLEKLKQFDFEIISNNMLTLINNLLIG